MVIIVLALILKGKTLPLVFAIANMILAILRFVVADVG